MLHIENNKLMQNVMLLAVLMIGLFFTGTVQAQKDKLIAEYSAGKIKMGMTVAQARKAVSPMTISKGVDEYEGDMRHQIKLNGKTMMTILVGGTASSFKGRIVEIAVMDKSFKTSKGVSVGMLLSAAEKKYGKITEIRIEEGGGGAEVATFTNQPKGIKFILSVEEKVKRAGRYANDSETTTEYAIGAKIYSIIVYDQGE